MNQRIRELLQREPGPASVTAEGWVRTKRDSKNFCFFEISDGSCLKNLQVIVDKTTDEITRLIHRTATGASIRCTGILSESPGKGQRVEMKADTFELVGESPPESYPLQKKRHSFEFLREIAHLRPRTNTIGAVTRIRSKASHAIHSFFQERDFYYIHTPVITGLDCEGAGEMFQVTSLPPGNIPVKEGKPDYSQDFFGRQTSLTVSGQLEAEIYALALKHVYTFGPTFRAENSNTARHLAEFWMVEPEMAFCTLEGNMHLAEEFLKELFAFVLRHCSEDMELFNRWVQPGLTESLRAVTDSRFTHMTYTDAVQELSKAEKDFEFPVSWGMDLQSEHEKYLTETVCAGPVIVTDYPKDIKAFYMKLNDDEKTVKAMDVLVPRLGEIIGGSEREDRHDVLSRRMEETGLNPSDYWWYLDLRRYGSVPHSGFGLGFERAIQYITGMQNIRDVIPFPRTVGSAEF